MIETIKSKLPIVGAILLFAVISLGYFLPDIMEGKVLMQGDMQQGIAIGQEAKEYTEATGERTRWTNSLFGGMPTYQIAPAYDSTTPLSFLQRFFSCFLPNPAGWVFMMMFGFYILMRVLKMSNTQSILGAIAWGFSSYFFILIEAGHIWKFITLAYIPPTIAGFIMIFRKQYLSGGIVFAFFTAMQILSNHVQMSYYFLFVMAALGIAYFIEAIKQKDFGGFFKSFGVLLIAGGIGVAANISNLYHTYEYSKYTTRGKSELTPLPSSAPVTQSANGLDKEYITQWSYGIGESWTLLVPNAKGGATSAVGQDAKLMKEVNPTYREFLGQMNQYWGDQPFTSGPVYVGAFVLALFILGIFIIKGPVKWGLLIATILTLMLSWGKNFMGLTNLFIDYFPMYSKFRAVSSILVVVEFTVPLLAMMALWKLVNTPDALKKYRNPIFISLGLTAGIALFFAVTKGAFFEFMSNDEKKMFLPALQAQPEYRPYIDALEELRRGVFAADAWRSLFIIVVSSLVMFGFFKKWYNKTVLFSVLIAITLLDLGLVDKRYLNSENFVSKQKSVNPFPKSVADEAILADKDPNYRVLNFTVNTFNDATTSYYHKSVGGYHAAKLSRYQDLIERQISKNNQAVLDMLNTKYIIVPDSMRQPVVMPNPNAMGNAWFIGSIRWADNADQEMEALNQFNPSEVAVVNKKYKETVGSSDLFAKDSTANIRLTSYQPNKLIYTSDNKQEGFAVFSEIYYPKGWVATIDGKEQPIVNVNYVLRGLTIPAGKHEIIFTFDPQSVKTTETIAYIALALLFIGTIVAFVLSYKKNKNQCTDSE